MSGPRNPYQAGKLGVIEAGGYADLILVDGNPLEDITVIGGTDQWFDAPEEWEPIDTIDLVMLNGAVYVNEME